MMKRRMEWVVLAAISASQCQAQGWNPFLRVNSRPSTTSYNDVVLKVADMVADRQANQIVNAFNLNLLNLTWEDTGRYKNSAVGPNISDLTIQVAYGRSPEREHVGRGQVQTALMPVIRKENFSDVTGDIDPRNLALLVGNEKGRKDLQYVSLADYLQTPTEFMSHPAEWLGRTPKSLWADRDSKVLVSAQACFLPVPTQGKATFHPVLFNYQSTKGAPAVLTILATREGTSMTVIDNARDTVNAGYTHGQMLFMNSNGMRAPLTAVRKSDFVGGPSSGGRDPNVANANLNMVLVIQVPLKHKEEPRAYAGFGGGGAAESSAKPASAHRQRSDFEEAVIGHGDLQGPFTEVGRLPIERDPRFPVRVTVQYYFATSNGVVDQNNMKWIQSCIEGTYAHADSVGSLVTEGRTGRPTEYWGSKVQPANWWQEFWRRYQADTGIDPQTARRRLRDLMGPSYEGKPVTELYLRGLLRF